MPRPKTISDEAVLASAAAAVAHRGPGAVTLAEIGAGAGLSPATLLQRFGSKRGLLLALARHGAQELPQAVLATRAERAPVACLVDVLVRLADGIQAPAQFAHHLAFLLLDVLDPEFQQVTRRYCVDVEHAIDAVLDAGREAGEITDRSAGLARAVHTAYNGALVTWGMHGGGEGPAGPAVREQLAQVLAPHQRPPTGHVG